MRKLVLWGHGIEDYREMFDLPQGVENLRLLEYGCGPSAVNYQQTQVKKQGVVSCDPLFVLDKDTLLAKTKMIFANMAEEVRQHQDQFDFSRNGSLDKLLQERQEGMKQFFADYEQGKADGRYLGLTDYHLPFADFTFDFALSSHYFLQILTSKRLIFT